MTRSTVAEPPADPARRAVLKAGAAAGGALLVGFYTAVAMILAEELDAAFEHVVVEAAPPNDKLYANPTFGIQVTGNSNSVRAFWTPLRKAGASARAMLVQAAAKAWNTDAADCRTEHGEVIHNKSGKRLGYGALISQASSLTPP